VFSVFFTHTLSPRAVFDYILEHRSFVCVWASPSLSGRNMRPRIACELLIALPVVLAYVPPEQQRHEQLVALQATFSRFNGHGLSGTISQDELPNFLRRVVSTMSSPALSQEELAERSSDLTKKFMSHLPSSPKQQVSLQELMQVAEKLIGEPQLPATEDSLPDRGRLGTRLPIVTLLCAFHSLFPLSLMRS
jgi:hypothetical protein